MVIKKENMRKIKHMQLDLRESVHELTCRDILKIIHIAKHAEGKVFFGIDSKRVYLDVLEKHVQEVEHALLIKGFHSETSQKMTPRQARFSLQSNAELRKPV